MEDGIQWVDRTSAENNLLENARFEYFFSFDPFHSPLFPISVDFGYVFCRDQRSTRPEGSEDFVTF